MTKFSIKLSEMPMSMFKCRRNKLLAPEAEVFLPERRYYGNKKKEKKFVKISSFG